MEKHDFIKAFAQLLGMMSSHWCILEGLISGMNNEGLADLSLT